MKKVVIIYRTLFQYREEFYNQLRTSLLKENVQLSIFYGKLQSEEFKSRKDQIDLTWGKYIENKIFRVGKKELIWQPCLEDLKDQEMVIVEQANKLLINYYLMFNRRRLGFKFCYWGHGRNRQMNENSIFNKFKYMFIKKCDWWFAYTQEVKEFLMDMGFPENKITAVQNAIDTDELRNKYAGICQDEVEKIKKDLKIKSNFTGIYCGAMYAEKRIDFLLEACYRVKREIPDFNMIFIGSGKDQYKIEEAAKKQDWIHCLGSKFGQDRVKYFKIAAVQMMPGAVGLGILDSFAMETPLITTVQDFHGPEISYLENGKNGIITPDNIKDYSNAIVNLLVSKHYVEMANNCKESAGKYTLENMVENFKTGILLCLEDN